MNKREQDIVYAEAITAMNSIAKILRLYNKRVDISDIGSKPTEATKAAMLEAHKLSLSHKAKRVSNGVSVKRVVKYRWHDWGIEDTMRNMSVPGKHTFSTAGMRDEKAASYHSAICNYARKVFSKTAIDYTTMRNESVITLILSKKKAVK